MGCMGSWVRIPLARPLFSPDEAHLYDGLYCLWGLGLRGFVLFAVAFLRSIGLFFRFSLFFLFSLFLLVSLVDMRYNKGGYVLFLI